MATCNELATKAELEQLRRDLEGFYLRKEEEPRIVQASIAGAVTELDPKIAAALAAAAAASAAAAALKGQLAAQGALIAANAAKVAANASTIAATAAKVVAVVAQVATLAAAIAGVVVLGRRIDAVESGLDSLAADFSLLFSAIGKNKIAIGNNSSKIEQLGGRVSSVEARSAVNAGRIDSLNSKTDKLGNLISGLNNKVDALGKQIQQLAVELGNLATSLRREIEAKFAEFLRLLDQLDAGFIAFLQRVLTAIGILGQDLSELNADIGSVRVKANQNSQEIAALKPRVSRLEQLLDSLRNATGAATTALDQTARNLANQAKQLAQSALTQIQELREAFNNLERFSPNSSSIDSQARQTAERALKEALGNDKELDFVSSRIVKLQGDITRILTQGDAQARQKAQQIEKDLADLKIQIPPIVLQDSAAAITLAQTALTTANTASTKADTATVVATQALNRPIEQTAMNAADKAFIIAGVAGVVTPKLNNLQGQIAGNTAGLTQARSRLEQTFQNSQTTARQTSRANQVANTQTGICNSMNGGCLGQGFNGLKNFFGNNFERLLNGFTAASTATNNLLNNKILRKVNEVSDKLGSKLPGGLSGFVKNAWEFTKADKIINLLNLAVATHNAALLSRNLAQTLGDAASGVLQFTGVRDPEGNSIDVNQVIGDSIENTLKNIVGEEVYNGVSTNWRNANRIISAAAGVVHAIQSMVHAAIEGIEVVGGWVAQIGNRGQEQGLFELNSLSWMDETPEFKNPYARLLNKVEDLEEATESAYQLISAGIEVQEAYTESVQATQELVTALETARTEKQSTEDSEVTSNTNPSGITDRDLLEGE